MKKLKHKFVECMPRPLEDGVLYISIPFRIASHNCCCGCGNEVVTNLSPNGWQLIYDGQSASLYPSIGNWNFKCRSHYWITEDTVRWAENWSDKKIQRVKLMEGHLHGDNVAKTSEKKPGTSKGKKSILAKVMGHLR
jgi:hypothetical protein